MSKELTADSEIVKFVDDTRNGKYTEDSCNIESLQNIRLEFEVVEDVDKMTENVILYGLSS